MATPQKSFDIPLRTKMFDPSGFISEAWQAFYRSLSDRIHPLGIERSFTIANNIASPTTIDGLKFDFRQVSQATVNWLVQRVTTGGGAVELIESGIFIVVYRPTSNDWDLVAIGTSGPDNSGVDLTIDSTGQIKYVSSNESGTTEISKLVYRTQTIGAKNALYSSPGGT